MKKRAWLQVALLFALFEGAVYGVASWAEPSVAWVDFDLPKIVFTDESDGTPLSLDEDEVRDRYRGSLRQIELHPDGVALLSSTLGVCPYGGSEGPVRGSWSLDGSRVRVSSSWRPEGELLSFQVVACERRPALRDENGELWRPSP